MNHDESLTDQDLAPELVVLTDALQLASQPGKLPLAIMTLKHRFPGPFFGRQAWLDPTTSVYSLRWAWTCSTSPDATKRPQTAFF